MARTDMEAMKKQAESTNAEYDRLAEEHQQLQVNFDLACKMHLQLHFLFFRQLCKEILKIRKTSEPSLAS